MQKYFTEDHEWISVEGDIATIGITDFAQSSLGDIVFVEFPEENQELSSKESFGVVESIKSVSDLYAPVSGIVTETNQDVEDSPETINDDASRAWLIKIKMEDQNELQELMSEEDYLNFIKEQ